MLDSHTKRRIDSARDILVGKVPDPKAQVEQITIALIYKFMDDMDEQSKALGGKAGFFTQGLEKYAWTTLLDKRHSAQEQLALYVEAIAIIPASEHIPELFRKIFKDSFLPFSDARTIRLFLKEINYFTYDNSENLGDAFEYLLSVLGSQGDAGQFRTPRHIIDFIVALIAPQKNETILDPACGTAGFLISAYKYIQTNHKLTPDENAKLLNSIEGYDISPDMVKLALVNFYLHGSQQPQISEYDTLTSEQRWGDGFDVILANPPFMTPKGGISPHDKFAVQANRAEVLFVDYIAEHLNLKGRAGIVVPEGIIFQASNAYKQLRKNLIENWGLYAVVSLPNGVFQPYSGVKTSILLLDKNFAKKSKAILFIKIANDGFNLGAQRQAIAANDLPQALSMLKAWQQTQKITTSTLAHSVSKAKIAEDGDYNLTGERYRQTVDYSNTKWPMVALGDVCELIRGVTYAKTDEVEANGKKVLRANNIDLGGNLNFKAVKFVNKDFDNNQILKKNDIFICLASGSKSHIGKVAFIDYDTDCYFGGFMGCIRTGENVSAKYIFQLLNSKNFNSYLTEKISGVNINNLSKKVLYRFKIPFPPLEIQEKIVAEIENYQKIIAGAKQLVENWKPTIKTDPKWDMVALSDVCENLDSKRKPVTKSDRAKGQYPYYGASGIVDYVKNYIFDKDLLLISEDGANLLARSTPIAFSVSGKIWVNNHAHVLKFQNFATQKFVEIYINSIDVSKYVSGMAQPKLNQRYLNSIKIPLPPLEIQEKILAEIEAEQETIDECKKLIAAYEQKISATINEVSQDKKRVC